MYELITLTENDAYIDCPAKVGVVRTKGNEVVLIDSGCDKSAAKNVLRTLTAAGLTPTAIYNTHSHADHIGGNRFFTEKTGCRIYAPGLERTFTETPFLEPMTLYGGLPPADLRHKFLMADASPAEPLTDDVLPEGLQILRLPGHSMDMVGFLTADGTAYIADSVASPETLQKYGIGYMWDPDTALATLEYLRTLPAARFVPSHAPVCDSICELVRINTDAIAAVKENILRLCVSPVTFETLLCRLFELYGMTMSVQQYVLIGSTVRSYLTCLSADGRVTYRFDGNRMLWESV